MINKAKKGIYIRVCVYLLLPTRDHGATARQHRLYVRYGCSQCDVTKWFVNCPYSSLHLPCSVGFILNATSRLVRDSVLLPNTTPRETHVDQIYLRYVKIISYL